MVRTSTWTGQDCEVESILRIGSQGWNIRAAAVTARLWLWLLRSGVINFAFSCAVLQLGSMAGRFNISPAGCMDGGVHIVQAATLYKRLSGCWPHAICPYCTPRHMQWHGLLWIAVRTLFSGWSAVTHVLLPCPAVPQIGCFAGRPHMPTACWLHGWQCAHLARSHRAAADIS